MNTLPFTAAQARARGISKSGIRRLVASFTWSRVRRNAYVVTATADQIPELVIAAGAILPQLGGDPVMSHETAAELWGIPHLRPPTTELQFCRTRRGRGRNDYEGALIRHADMPEEHAMLVSGLPVTTPARTVIDIARMRAGLVVADAVLSPGDDDTPPLCTKDDLHRTISACRGWPNIRTVRWVIENASPLSESPLESTSMAAFHRFRVPMPAQQVWLAKNIRVDFLWEKARLIGEADGASKYETGLTSLFTDRARQARLRRLGYDVIRWGWREAFEEPKALANRVKRELLRRGVDLVHGRSSWQVGSRRWFLPPEPGLFPRLIGLESGQA